MEIFHEPACPNKMAQPYGTPLSALRAVLENRAAQFFSFLVNSLKNLRMNPGGLMQMIFMEPSNFAYTH